MYKEFSIQTFSLRDQLTNIEDIRRNFKRLADFGYSGIQACSAAEYCTIEEYAAAAREAGIKVIGNHTDIDKAQKTDEFIKALKILGAPGGGIGGLKEPTVKVWLERIEQINRSAEEMGKHGLKFTYHHHAWEFGRVEGVRPMDLLVDGLDKENISFVLDTYWLIHAGVDVNRWLEKLAGRVDILHLKDRAIDYKENVAHDIFIGGGNTDFTPILKTAFDTGVEHICVELDNWPKDANSLELARKSAENLKKILEI